MFILCSITAGADEDWRRRSTVFPDRDLALKFLNLGRRTGHPYTGGRAAGRRDHRAEHRGGGRVAGRGLPHLTARFRLPIGHILATAWLSLLQTIENPRIVVDAIPEIFDEARTTGQQPALLLGILGRDLMHPLAAIDRLDAVPILDAASTTRIRPALAADAVTRAQRHYGDEEYDR